MANGPDREYRVRVNQTIGVVAEQIGGTIPDAVALLQERSEASGESLDQLADAVSRGLRFGE